MPFDKESFLSGVAAGRNMKSWPLLDGDAYAGTVFALKVEIEEDQAGVMMRGLTVYMYDVTEPTTFFVSWGDGTSDVYTAYGVDTRHTYSSPGIYTVVYVGIPTYASIAGGLRFMAPYVVEILTPFPLLSAEWPTLPAVSDFADTYRAGKLTRVCSNLYSNFRYLDEPLWNINELFYGCSSLVSVDDTIFQGIRLRSGASANSLFEGASALESIGNVFRGETFENITSLRYTFSGCSSLTSIQEDILYSMPFLTDIGGCFSGTGLTSIPAGILSQCSRLQFANSCFGGTPITSIPPELFSECHSLLNVSNCFAWTPITSIPPELFSECPNITEFDFCFEGCDQITGDVPPLWELYPNANGEGCFMGCINAANYNEIPVEWKTRRV